MSSEGSSPHLRAAFAHSALEAALAAARRARKMAYAPYSGYRVGAALVTKNGEIYAGCNVENATFGATLCAERSAVAAMVAAGNAHPTCCVLVTEGREPVAPCGICRQVLAEFAPDLKLVLIAESASGQVVERSSARLGALLPHPFHLSRKPTTPREKRPRAKGPRAKGPRAKGGG